MSGTPFAGSTAGQSGYEITNELAQEALTCTGIETEVGPGHLHLGAAPLDKPALGLGPIAFVAFYENKTSVRPKEIIMIIIINVASHLHGRPIGENGTTNIKAFTLEEV